MTIEQLRNAIDSGRTGDKIPARDPAAAPLGADDEAAGSAPSAGATAQALQQELTAAPAHPQRGRGPGAAWVLIALILVFAALLLAWSLAIR